MFGLHTSSTCDVGGDRGITRKYGNLQAPQSTRKILELRKSNSNETFTSKNAPTTTSVGHRHTEALNK